MRVVYLHQYFNTPEMPGATRSFELARRLVAYGHEVHMVTTDRVPTAANRGLWRMTHEEGIQVYWARVPYSNKMRFVSRIWSFSKFAVLASMKAASLRGDVVFATSTPLTIALPAIYAKTMTSVPLVFEVRDLWPAGPIALGVLRNPILIALARWLEKAAYRSSSHVVALAPGMKNEIAASGVPGRKISVIPNGCDVALFEEARAEAAELRSSFAWLGDRPLVSYVGSLGSINAVDYLVEIAAEVFQLDSQVRFLIVGTGKEEDNIRNLAMDRGIYEENLFMLGALPKQRAAVWVCASTMTVALVRGPRFIWKDATQNKYFDSLAAGKPVASNYDGWQAQVASEAGAAIVLDPDDHAAAAKALLGALHDKKWLVNASRVANRLASECYSRDAHAGTLERILERVISGR